MSGGAESKDDELEGLLGRVLNVSVYRVDGI